MQTVNGPTWSFTTAGAPNNPPTATNLSAAETYTEDAPLNLINIVVTDADSPNVTATLTLSNAAAGSLNTATSGAVTSTYTAATGVWTVSGALASVNTLLAGLTFTPATNFNSGFTIATSVSDGVAPAVTGSKTMTGTAVNDAPTATNLSAAETYTEETALNLIDIVVTDVDSPNVTATLTLSNAAAGSLNTATSGTVTSTYTAGTGVWTASGALASVNTLLAGLTFTPATNFSSNFTIATSVSDGVAPAVTGSKTMSGTAVNDAPTATNLSAPETYTEDTALNLINIVVTDVDSSNVTATLTLSNLTAGSLTTGTSGAVTSTFNASTGVWSASGSLANVNTLLAGVSFNPAANFTSSFTIATSVSDGTSAVTGSKTMTGTAVNNAPTATNLSAAETYTEDTALNLINIVVTDPDSTTVTATLTLSNLSAGSLTTATTGTVTSTFNASTGVWSASGLVTDVNLALAGVSFNPASNFSSPFTIATSVSDGTSAVTGSKTITATAVNDAPTASNLSAAETYTEDTPLNLIDIVVTDLDSPNVTATLTLSALAAGSLNTATAGTVTSTFNAGTGVWTASGAVANVNSLLAGLTFTPASNFSSSFTIGISVSDGVAPAVTGSKTMTGTAVNDAPTATNLSAAETYTEDNALNLTDIVVTDGDSPNVTATLTLSNPAAGSLNNGTSGPVTSTFAAGVWTASGALANVNSLLAGLTFTPAANSTSGFTIATSVSDGVAPAVTGSKTMTGTAVNDAPTATNPSAAETYTEDTALNLTDIVVADGDSPNVTATLTLSNPAAGSLNTGTSGPVTSTFAAGVWTASGALANVNTLLAGLTFTPVTNFNGGFTIATSVSDGVAPAVTGSKTMTGTAVNDAPTATNLSAAETYTENVALNLSDIVITDPDSPNVIATLTLSDVAAGSLNTGTSGAVTSTFAAGVWTASGVLANINALLAGLTFTPATNFTSGFTIATSVSDGTAPAVTGSKTMTGTAVNDPPTATNLSAADTYTEDTALNLTDIVVTDGDSPNVTATLTLSNPAAGSLNTGTSGTVTSTFAAGVWTASGALANVNSLMAGLTFTPATNFNSGFTIATSVSDGTAPALTGSKTMTGTAVNDAPTATNLSAAETYTEETALNLIDIVVTDVDSANVTATLTLSTMAAGSLNTGTSGAVTSTFSAGVWTASGALANVNTLLAGLTFTPATNFTSGFTIATSVSDGAAPAVTGGKTITGTAVNDPPTATNLSAAETYSENVALNLTDIVIADVDSANVTATLTLSNAAAGSLNTGASGAVTSTYTGTGVWIASGGMVDVNTLLAGLTFTPAANFTASFTIATSVSDGVAPAVTGNKTMTGTAVNDAPTATNLSAAETYTEDTALNLADIVVADGDSPNVTATLTLSNPAAGSLNTGTSGPVTSTFAAGVWTASGALANVNTLLAGLTFTPATNFNGGFTIATSVSDGIAPALIGSKTMTGTAVNDPPTISDVTNQSTTEETATGAIAFTVGDTETAAGALTVTGSSDNQTLVPNANILPGGSGANRTVTITPAANQSGSATITVTVNDSTTGTSDTFTLTVTTVADTPSVTNAATNEDTQTTSGLVISRNVADSADVTHFKITGITNGSLYRNNGTTAVTNGTFLTFAEANAGLKFTPALNSTTNGSFTVQASTSAVDAGLGGGTVSGTITVTSVNDLPTISDIGNQSTNEGVATGAIGFTVGDVETAAATLTVSGSSDNQTLVPNTSFVFGGSGTARTVAITPAANQSGTATITIAVSDGLVSTFDTFVLNVAAAGVGPTVQILSPNGGERLFTGSPFMIQWNATPGAAALGTFSVQYSTNNGTFLAVPGCTNLGAAMRQCMWATPIITTLGRLRVIATDTAGQSSTDDSDATFSVVSGSPSVTVNNPSGGSMVIGTVAALTWTHNVGTATFPVTFEIAISRNSTTGPWEVIASNVPQATATTGRFDWTVVGPTSRSVRFRVRPTNLTVQGTSRSNLAIANPSLALLYPARSVTLRIGRRATFLWLTNLGSTETVKIEVSRDAGVTWEPVAESVPANLIGTYGWVVTGPATTQMRARLTWNRNPAVSTASSANNRITP